MPLLPATFFANYNSGVTKDFKCLLGYDWGNKNYNLFSLDDSLCFSSLLR